MHHRQWAPGQPFQRLKWQPNADVHVTLVDLRKAIRCTNEAVETHRDLAALVKALLDGES